MTSYSTKEGVVTSVDQKYGVCMVRFPDETSAVLHVGVFYSGQEARWPRVGDLVVADVRSTEQSALIRAARLK